MGVSDIAAVFQSSLCIALLAVVLLKLWPAARLDAFRQEMFAIRDGLFDYAASGKITFDNPAYRLLRQSMNGSIRYGHQLTFFRVNMTLYEIKLGERVSEPTWSTKWEKALTNIPDETVRNELTNFHERAMTCIAKRLVFGSPFLIVLLALAVPFIALQLGWHKLGLHNLGLRNLRQIYAKAATFTVSHTLDTRLIENEAAAAAVA